MEIAFSKRCDTDKCNTKKLATWYKSLLAVLGCFATVFYYTAKSPVIFPSQSWAQMGINPAVIGLIGPLIPLAIMAVVWVMSVAIVLSDNYEHSPGVFFASIGVPAVIFTLLKTVV